MSKLREPRDVAAYATAGDAADALEELAASIRARNVMVKWAISLRYWDPRWLKPETTSDPAVRLLGIKYHNLEQKAR